MPLYAANGTKNRPGNARYPPTPGLAALAFQAKAARRAARTGGLDVAKYEGYCVKCREKREFEGNEVELANGRRAAQGTCPTCGTKMNRMLGKAS